MPTQNKEIPTLTQTRKKRLKIRVQDKRIPRPQGLTYLCNRYHQENNPNLKNKALYQIKYLLVNHYLTRGFQLNQYQYTPLEYIRLYGITTKEYTTITKDIIGRTTGITDLTDNAQVQEAVRVKLLQALNGALGDKHQVESQVRLLLAAQGRGYVPFVTAEVNKILKTNIDATKNLADIAKSLLPQAGIVINNNNSNRATMVTVEKAVELLETEATYLQLASSGSLPDNLLEANLGDVPEIHARHQSGEVAKMVHMDKKKKTSSHDDRRLHTEDYADIVDE